MTGTDSLKMASQQHPGLFDTCWLLRIVCYGSSLLRCKPRWSSYSCVPDMLRPWLLWAGWQNSMWQPLVIFQEACWPRAGDPSGLSQTGVESLNPAADASRWVHLVLHPISLLQNTAVDVKLSDCPMIAQDTQSYTSSLAGEQGHGFCVREYPGPTL